MNHYERSVTEILEISLGRSLLYRKTLSEFTNLVGI